jgi:hypothetical protein
LNRLLKGHLMNGGFVIPVVLKRRFKRRSSMVGAWDVVLNDKYSSELSIF